MLANGVSTPVRRSWPRIEGAMLNPKLDLILQGQGVSLVTESCDFPQVRQVHVITWWKLYKQKELRTTSYFWREIVSWLRAIWKLGCVFHLCALAFLPRG